MNSKQRCTLGGSSWCRRRSWAALTLAFLVGCGAAAPGDRDELDPDGAASEAAAQPEDGLAEAYDVFVQNFVANNFDAQFLIGYGFHPGMSTEKVIGPSERPASGQATLDMNTGRVSAFLTNLPAGGTYDLWFVRNVPGPNRSAVPEAGDEFLKVGRFEPLLEQEEFRVLTAGEGRTRRSRASPWASGPSSKSAFPASARTRGSTR